MCKTRALFSLDITALSRLIMYIRKKKSCHLNIEAMGNLLLVTPSDSGTRQDFDCMNFQWIIVSAQKDNGERIR